MRAVLDPNVIISGFLGPAGSPANVLRAWEQGQFELIVFGALLDELARALSYPKLRRRVSEEEADAVARWISGSATTSPDPKSAPPVRSTDSGDDYLIALASAERAVLVSGDAHLLDLAAEIPVIRRVSSSNCSRRAADHSMMCPTAWISAIAPPRGDPHPTRPPKLRRGGREAGGPLRWATVAGSSGTVRDRVEAHEGVGDEVGQPDLIGLVDVDGVGRGSPGSLHSCQRFAAGS